MFKDILLYVSPAPARSESVAAYVAALASTGDAHVRAVGFRFEQTIKVPELTSDIGELMEDIVARERADLDAAFGLTRTACAGRGVPFTTGVDVAPVDDVARRFAELGHLADLIVLPNRVQKLNAEGPAIERALFDSGRPLLLVPEAPDVHFSTSHVMVAWDDSGPAARALSDALPLLARAGRVTVVTVGDDRRVADNEAVVRHLARHGIRATAATIPRRGRIGDTLLEYAVASVADIVVMGGFGHSRLREFVIGGVTRTFIDEARLPVLMAR